MLHAVTQVWRRLALDHLPARIDPLDIPKPLLPYILILDYSVEPEDILARLAGTAVCENHGGELRGRSIFDVFEPKDAQLVLDSLKGVLARRGPTLARREFVSLDNTTLSYVRLILPLSSDGVTIDRFFNAVEPSSQTNARRFG